MSREELLRAFDGLRVADVRDAMDELGFHHYGSLSRDFRPLWPCRVVGLARTARYLPFRGPAPEARGDAYAAYSDDYYRRVCSYPWIAEIEPGDVAVIDTSGVSAGLVGSENSLAVIRRGGRGLVVTGGIRDSDEVILQRVPVWSSFTSQSMVQARIQFESTGRPVALGGVHVATGDVIVADSDGVIAVPAEAAADVARRARPILDADKASRRRHYDALGRDADETVR